jgi:NAD(P)-dependent dehydrogenase (short-subunit alcohol dehydrogenase family)
VGRLQDKVAIVTGAAGGIGRATSLKMASEGARVLVADVLGEAAQKVATEIEQLGGTALAHQVDISVPDEIFTMVSAAVEAFGGLDIMHNNAADTALTLQDHDIANMDLDVWDRTIAVNLRGLMMGCRASIPHLIARGGGAIINTTSISADAGDLRYSAYGASKGGINSVTLYVATQYGKQGIRCNAVAPGLVLTPNALEMIPAGPRAEYERQHLTRRLGRPEDIANMVAFLASDEAEFITGQIIRVDGGLFSHNPTVAAFRESD